MKRITSSRFILPLLFLLLASGGLMAQQVIGSFPSMDGGFEAGASSGTMTSGSIASGSTSSVWTTSSSSLATFLTASPRTGLKYVNFVGGGTKRLQSPTFNATMLTNQQYTLQYYYKTTSTTATGAFMQIGASIDGTQTPTYYPSGAPYANLAGTSNVWTKYSAQFTLANGGSAGKYGIGIIRTQSAIAVPLDIDDVVMYAGGLDETAPDPVTSPTIPAVAATQQTISWTAPATGVDGGGYMVVRGTSDPTTVPNVNGVYQVGNTLSTGQQVVYLGTSPSFIDLGLTALTHYYYRIYTVDKAFNYSSSVAIDGTTVAPSYAAEPTVQASNISFANVTSTGFDINWTAGNGTNSLVVVRAASAITADPADGGTYAPNTVYGSGTQIGTGNYAVYNGTSNTVSITGLSKATTYYVKVYTFNGSGGSENYLTTNPASASQLASPGEIISTGSNRFIDGRTWNTTSAWVNGIVPGQSDNVTIATGDTLLITSTTASCYNLTIQPGAKLFINSSSATYHSFYGNSLVCNGVLGDKMTDGTTDCGFCIQFFGNMTISGSGTIRPNKIRPGSGATNASVTFASNTDVTYTSSSIISDYATNDNISYTVNPGVTLSVYGNWPNASSTGTNGTANTTLNFNGTCNIAKAFATPIATGKTCTVNIGSSGILNIGTSCSPYSYTSGAATTFNVNGVFNLGTILAPANLYVTPSTAVIAPVINVGSTGVVNVYGTADFSNTTVAGSVIGAGTFNLLSGGTINIVNASGLEPVAGHIRTTNRSFNTGAKYSYLGSSAQATGSDLPATVANLTINNAAGVSLTSPVTVSSTLTLTSGKLSLGANDLTPATISGASATNYIVTDGAGKLNQTVADGATKLFPVGASVTSYDPVSVTPVTGTSFGVKAYSTLSGTAPYGVRYNPKEWDITPAVASSTLIALTPSNLVESVSSPVIGHYVSGAYVNNQAVTVSGGTFSGTFDTFSPFVTGANVDVTGLRNGENNAVKVYTDKNQLIVNGTLAGDEITVYGLNGQIIAKSLASGNQSSMDLSRGLYLIAVKSGNNISNFKVVMN